MDALTAQAIVIMEANPTWTTRMITRCVGRKAFAAAINDSAVSVVNNRWVVLPGTVRDFYEQGILKDCLCACNQSLVPHISGDEFGTHTTLDGVTHVFDGVCKRQENK